MSTMEKFRELGISELTLKALKDKGFTEPSPIQAAAIPLLMAGEKDVIGQALTGTGKTAAFAIPIIECITPGAKCVQALVMAPTRELAMQVAGEIESLAGTRRISVAAVFGGQAIDIQLRKLRAGADIVVGTPGRIMDLLERRALDISGIEFCVLDEADEMLNMGFVEDIETILENAPAEKQMMLFSATMPKPIQDIAEKFMRDYEVVNVKTQTTNADLTEQCYYEVRREEKVDALIRLIEVAPEMYAMVFCRTKLDVDELAERMQSAGFQVEPLHGDIAQAQRTKVIERFKNRKFNILIATDVAARGIDVNNLTHVINFAIPQNSETYIHRIGRTGRAGNIGTAVTFITPSELRKIIQIQREIKSPIEKKSLPSGIEAADARRNNFLEKVGVTIAKNQHANYLDFAATLLERNDAAQMLAAILRVTVGNELDPATYREIGSKGGERAKSDRHEGPKDAVRLFIAAGKKDGYGAKKVLDLIFDKTGLKSYRIGKVSCYDKFSYVDATPEDAERIITSFNSGKGRNPFVEIAREDPGKAAPMHEKKKTAIKASREMLAEIPIKKARKKAPKQ